MVRRLCKPSGFGSLMGKGQRVRLKNLIQSIICINMVHITPWAATVGLMRGAAAILKHGAPLYLYGPFRREGGHTAPTNAAFDADLRARNPAWAVRDLEAVAEEATRNGFALDAVVEMPANNLSVIFRR